LIILTLISKNSAGSIGLFIAIPLADLFHRKPLLTEIKFICLAAAERDVFCYFYFWPLCNCAIDYRVCHH
jgi:hypothetical protein